MSSSQFIPPWRLPPWHHPGIDPATTYYTVSKDGVVAFYTKRGNQFMGERRKVPTVEKYSRKAAKRVLFWLEKNHWAQTELEVVQQWLKEGIDTYLETSNEFIECCAPVLVAPVRYEEYLARLGHYVERRERKESVQNNR